MDTKTYLGQISRLNFRIKNKMEEINQLRDMACSISVSPKEVNVQSSGEPDKMGSLVSKIADAEVELAESIEHSFQKKREITQQIEMITNTNQYRVLYNRYVLCKNWKTITSEMECSFRGAMSIHGRALQEFEKLFGSYYL